MSAAPDDATWAAMREAAGTTRTVSITLVERTPDGTHRYPLGACIVHRIDQGERYDVAYITPDGEDGVRAVPRPRTPVRR